MRVCANQQGSTLRCQDWGTRTGPLWCPGQFSQQPFAGAGQFTTSPNPPSRICLCLCVCVGVFVSMCVGKEGGKGGREGGREGGKE